MIVLPACTYVHHENHLKRLEESIKAPGTGVMGGYNPPCGCWETNLYSLTTELSLQPLSVTI